MAAVEHWAARLPWGDEMKQEKEVWDKPRPKDLGESKALSPAQKAQAMRRAAKAGRPYPNLIDNMLSAKGQK